MTSGVSFEWMKAAGQPTCDAGWMAHRRPSGDAIAIRERGGRVDDDAIAVVQAGQHLDAIAATAPVETGRSRATSSASTAKTNVS